MQRSDVVMTPQQFGALALQLLHSAKFPGTDEAIDAVVAFRERAQSLAEGRLTLTEAAAPKVADVP